MSKVVLALSGSARPNSFTEKMLELCLKGMGDDCEVYKFYPSKMNIKPCIGCKACWKNKGKCVQKDNFQEILNVYMKADYFLIAAPLYYYGFPGYLKNVIDRFFVFLEPKLIEGEDGATTHPIRGDRHPKTILISSCGFPELKNFDLLRLTFREICSGMKWEHSGEILVPGAGAAAVPKLFEEKYRLIKHAGHELVEAGKINKATSAAIADSVISNEDYRAMCTASIKGKLGKVKAAFIGFKNVFFRRNKKDKQLQLK